MKYLEQQQEDYTIAQRQELLQIAYNEQPRENINETFVKVESITAETVLISEFGLYDMQTFLEVFQTGSIPRRTTDQVRYHYIVKTSYKMHAVLICIHCIYYYFDAFLILQHCRSRVHAMN